MVCVLWTHREWNTKRQLHQFNLSQFHVSPCRTLSICVYIICVRMQTNKQNTRMTEIIRFCDSWIFEKLCIRVRTTKKLINQLFFLHFLRSMQHLDIVSPFQLYFNPTLIVLHYQVWRLITTFLFFGTIGFNFLFNMTFTYRYCRMLEEGSFRGKSSDFIMMFIFGGALMIVSWPKMQANWAKCMV